MTAYGILFSLILQNDALALDELIAIGRFAAARGWVPATSGNFSARLPDGRIAITRSGADKGALVAADFALLDADAPVPPGVSAETPLHLARYRSDPGVGAVVHVHSVAATVLSRADAAGGRVLLAGFEMLKSMAGVATHELDLAVPIFPNSQDMPALARTIETQLGGAAPVPGYLLAGHGLYAWGRTVQDARRHVEGLEFLLTCALEERRIQK